ncbi:cytochrome c biogenesis protein/redoxin [Romboutsia sedimentorum]|uniref:Cytochrome c biogenesis protein/redoxin n=1 Tax=Romboutsia sedimentorum TaxID=1368474 RepID=A0ABT7E9Y7_9FIRM|nr:cytochrome c biogenesis protein/redoxin [Romboutsia sedimentorum]MDK2563744.1 cytochrome c biogenesis protein/redoxin [Romboutsia sedimentorum]
MGKLNLVVVFLEGVLSFFSPCILPILPIYLSMLSNSNIENLKSGKFIRSSLFKNTLFFIIGISTTFFILGSSVNALSAFFNTNKDLIMIIGGIIIIFMGLFYMGIIKSSILNREKRFNIKAKEMNCVSSFILGFTFSFGWTPCIGPILASVLIMSSSSDDTIMSSLLIVVYTLGFVLPFILVALFYNKLFNTIDKIKNHMDKIKHIGGIILIVSGVVMFINGLEGTLNYFESSTKNKVENNQSLNEAQDNEKIKALDFVLYDQYGKEHKLSDYKGKTIFLNFWATWCPPCREEMPYIEQLYNEYNKNNDDVIILGLASPNLGNEVSQSDIEKFLEDENYTFPVMFDKDGSLTYQYGINSFPSTFIIDKEGYIKQYVPGAMDKETMKQIIEN